MNTFKQIILIVLVVLAIKGAYSFYREYIPDKEISQLNDSFVMEYYYKEDPDIPQILYTGQEDWKFSEQYHKISKTFNKRYPYAATHYFYFEPNKKADNEVFYFERTNFHLFDDENNKWLWVYIQGKFVKDDIEVVDPEVDEDYLREITIINEKATNELRDEILDLLEKEK